MSVLIYASSKSAAGKKLHRILKLSIPEETKMYYRTIDELSQRLRRSRGGNGAAVFLADSQAELSGILSLRDLFWDLPIILILPDQEKETLIKGRKIYPRFISDVGSSLEDVGTVLRNMLGYKNSGKQLHKKGGGILNI